MKGDMICNQRVPGIHAGFNLSCELTKIREVLLPGFFLPPKKPMTSLLHPLIKKLSDGRFHSGADLGNELDVSRAAISKAMKKINALGLVVHSVKGKGYRMEDVVSLLDADQIRDEVTKHSASKIHHLNILGTIDSTNSYAMRCIQEDQFSPEPGKYAITLAEQQTSGKGRRGRHWISPFGQNVYFTMVRLVDTGVINTEGLSLVIGLAVVRALKSFGIADLAVKWPNDVLCKNRKLAGILLEITGDVTGICHLLIGVGINSRCRPEDMEAVSQPWTDLYQMTGKLFDRNTLAASTLSHIIQAMDELEAHGFKNFQEEWQRVDVMMGKRVELISGTNRQFGVARGISEQGALLFEDAAGIRAVSGGEISLRSTDSQ